MDTSSCNASNPIINTENWGECLKPGLYFMLMRSVFDMNLLSNPSFHSDIRKWVEHSWTAANYLLGHCDVNIRFAFAFAGSMNRALFCHGWVDKSTKLKLWCFCSAECGFESRSWHFCLWARHLPIIASLHPGVNGYLHVQEQRWFLWLIRVHVVRYIFGSIGCILPGSWDGLRNELRPSGQW